MRKRDARATIRKLDENFFLEACGFFGRLNQAKRVDTPLVLDGEVVGVVSARLVFGCVPEAVAAVNEPLASARFAELLGEFLEFVLLTDEAESDDARADIG